MMNSNLGLILAWLVRDVGRSILLKKFKNENKGGEQDVLGIYQTGITSDIVLNQQARWPMKLVWRIAYRAAQLLESPWLYRTQELMAILETRPWWVTL
jgi:hypothetical protein